MSDQELMTLREAAAYFKLHYQTIREKVANGEIPSIKWGRVYRVKKDDIIRYMERTNKQS